MLLLQALLVYFCPSFATTIFSIYLQIIYNAYQFLVNYCEILRLLWLIASYLFEANIKPQIFDFFETQGLFGVVLMATACGIVFKMMLAELGYELQIGFKSEENVDDREFE